MTYLKARSMFLYKLHPCQYMVNKDLLIKSDISLISSEKG